MNIRSRQRLQVIIDRELAISTVSLKLRTDQRNTIPVSRQIQIYLNAFQHDFESSNRVCDLIQKIVGIQSKTSEGERQKTSNLH